LSYDLLRLSLLFRRFVICFFFFTKQKRKRISPPPQTNTPPRKMPTKILPCINILPGWHHTHTHTDPNLTRLPLKKDGEQKERQGKTHPNTFWVSSHFFVQVLGCGWVFDSLLAIATSKKHTPTHLDETNRTRHDIFS